VKASLEESTLDEVSVDLVLIPFVTKLAQGSPLPLGPSASLYQSFHPAMSTFSGQNPSSQTQHRTRRKRGRLPPDATDLLKAWFHNHFDHPYPSEEEKKSLCRTTGLTMTQISNWMINVSAICLSNQSIHLANDISFVGSSSYSNSYTLAFC
jgi:hypothetical protein